MKDLPSDLFAPLRAVGLNLHGVLAVRDLPEGVRDLVCAAAPDFTEGALWVVGHQGRDMWDHLCELWGTHWTQNPHRADAIDAWARESASQMLNARGVAHRCLFPSPEPLSVTVPLQQLGRALGWHHSSPFQVGIDAEWGSWFAYRAVFAVDASGPVSAPRRLPSPCATCSARACEQACPAGALSPTWDMDACMNHRLRDDSSCAATCWARRACPVGAEHAYDQAQMAYHYGHSLGFIRRWRASSADEQ